MIIIIENVTRKTILETAIISLYLHNLSFVDFMNWCSRSAITWTRIKLQRYFENVFLLRIQLTRGFTLNMRIYLTYNQIILVWVIPGKLLDSSTQYSVHLWSKEKYINLLLGRLRWYGALIEHMIGWYYLQDKRERNRWNKHLRVESQLTPLLNG